MPHIFLSYSRKDTEFVDKLERDLNARGIVTWRDRSGIPPGSPEWHNEIADALDDASAVVLIVTESSDESRWVAREVLYADQKGLPVIAVLPSNFSPREHLRLIMISAQPVRFDDPAHENGLVRLVAALADIEKQSRPSAKTAADGRISELQYLDFLLAEMKADLRTARYVNLGATRESAVLQQLPSIQLDEFELFFNRLEPLVKAERIHGEAIDPSEKPVEDAREPLMKRGRFILLGDPGSGKTTTLQQLAIDLARAAQHDPVAPLPVFVRLQSYTGEEPFAQFVQRQLGPLQNEYERLLTEGRLTLQCDALSEMQRQEYGRNFVEDVRNYLQDLHCWVVSCRVQDYREELNALPDVVKVRLKPLDLPRIKQVIDRRFYEEPERAAALWADLNGSNDLLETWKAFEVARKEDSFWERPSGRDFPDDIKQCLPDPRQSLRLFEDWKAMHDDPRCVLLLCRNSFMLFMVCETFGRVGKLPPNRGALFANFVDNLLRREEANSYATGRAWIGTETIRRALTQVAYAMQKSEMGTEIRRTEAESVLSLQQGISDPTLLLRLAASASLLDVGERVRFSHELLQVYFDTAEMAMAMEEKRSATEFWPVRNWWEPQGWEETAFRLAWMCGDPESVARWIAPAQPALAYKVLTKGINEIKPDEMRPETLAVLLDGAITKKREVNPAGRAMAYRVIGSFRADRRPGVGLRPDGTPDIAWAETIKAGVFDMGGDQEADHAWKGAQFSLDYPFWIARYPVTNVQYGAFVCANGYGEGCYWTKAGLWWTQNRAEHNLGGYNQWCISNHPVSDVHWLEAYAFTQWLDELRQVGKIVLPPGTPSDYVLRLPTEAEWEKAARYPDSRKFPWGNEPDITKLNSYENGIGETSAVGIFPVGVSSTGAYDLSGNVAEWCLSQWSEEYHFPENNDPEGIEARVVRGGSYTSFLGHTRAASRTLVPLYPDWLVPYVAAVGFRVVCSVPL